TRAADYSAWVVYCNLVGGQDELVFDGRSLVIHPNGNVVAHGASFQEDLLIVDLDLDAVWEARLHEPRPRKLDVDLRLGRGEEGRDHGDDAVVVTPHYLPGILGKVAHPWLDHALHIGVEDRDSAPWDWIGSRDALPDPSDESLEGEVYHALVRGVRDYVRKNRVSDVIVGMSGGIDSSLVITIAVDALGAEHVHGIAMPSRFNASASEEDARQLAAALGIDFRVIPIEPIFTAFLDALAPSFTGTAPNVAEENVQARTRGSLWMALTNKFGWIALTAGNKSEMATGYATLYGDMAGGFAVLKDVPKTLVYRLARFRNTVAGTGPIPERVFTKAPSAELRPNQRDTDSLPPYEDLDAILEAYIERDWDFEHLVSAGHAPATVERVVRLIDGAEYKRRQAPPGIKITPRAFGRDRRLPITNRFHEGPAES
ncbi:MAG: NAD+ synthase, partial [Chloroflexi bacterium]|nr:NAD+ synthase [Chloroflexota bacterium]